MSPPSRSAWPRSRFVDRFTVATVLALVVAGTGGPVAAEDPGPWAANVEKHLDGCQPRAVAQALTDTTVTWLAKTPEAALRVLRAAFRNARCYSEDAAADARAVAAKGLDLARAVRAGGAVAPLPDLAQAYALACYARTTLLVGGQTTRADWTEPADLFKAAHACEPGTGESLAGAVDMLTEWSAIAGDETTDALAEAQALASAAVKQQPASVPVRLAAARADVQAGLAGLVARKDASRAALARGLDVLGANVPAFEADRGAVQLYHAGLRAARLADVATKAPFVMDQLDGRGWMEIGLPRGQGWEFLPAETEIEKTRMFARLRKVVDETSSVTIELWYFQWSLNYTWDKVQVAGDNISSIVEQTRKWLLDWLGEGRTADKPLKGKLSRTLPDAAGFEATGKQPDGNAYRSRWWFFKSRERRVSWQVSIIASGEGASVTDPEVEAILASLKEPKEKAK